MKEDYYGFVYLWENTHPEVEKYKYYIGRHKGKVEDGYKGSGKIFNQQLSKYKPYWKRSILKYCFSNEELNREEMKFIREVNAIDDDRYCNIIEPTIDGCIAWNTGKELTQEHKSNISMAKKGSQAWNKGKVGYRVDSDETKQKRIDSVKAVGDVKRAERDEKVLTFITENSDTTTKDLKEHLGKSGRMVIESLWRLMEKGLISKRRDGKQKKTYYNKK